MVDRGNSTSMVLAVQENKQMYNSIMPSNNQIRDIQRKNSEREGFSNILKNSKDANLKPPIGRKLSNEQPE